MEEPDKLENIEECKPNRHMFSPWSHMKTENGIRFQERKCMKCGVCEAKNPKAYNTKRERNQKTLL